MRKRGTLITYRLPTKEQQLGPTLHGNRKITLEFKKVLDELTSIIGKGNEFSKEIVKRIFCLDNPEAKKDIIEELIKQHPEKENKIVNIINKLEPFMTSEHSLIKEITDKETTDTYRNGHAIKKMLINEELIEFVIKNKYTDNFRFNFQGEIVDLDIVGNVINMDDN
jgi:hypothetical protein